MTVAAATPLERAPDGGPIGIELVCCDTARRARLRYRGRITWSNRTRFDCTPGPVFIGPGGKKPPACPFCGTTCEELGR